MKTAADVSEENEGCSVDETILGEPELKALVADAEETATTVINQLQDHRFPYHHILTCTVVGGHIVK